MGEVGWQRARAGMVERQAGARLQEEGWDVRMLLVVEELGGGSVPAGRGITESGEG